MTEKVTPSRDRDALITSFIDDIISGANIVSHDGYYEIDTAALFAVASRFEREFAQEAEQRAMERWTCFHCGETFTDRRCARMHFGRDENSETACIIKAGAEGSLLRALRDAEEQADDAIQAMHSESTDAAKAYHSQRTRHTQALIAAEELGYERGLADGRSLSPAPESTEKAG